MYLIYAGICTGAAALTFVVLEVVRHLQYRKFRGAGFVPGTQHLCLIAVIIAGILELLAIVFLILWIIYRVF
ncbi:hypothetical protein BH23PLA1_BH23PLA1_38620 [soil metagenome]